MEFKKDTSHNSKGYEIKNNALMFGSNGYLGSFIHNENLRTVKRTERIATAVYLVTECIDTTEPLREKIRSCVLELVSGSHRLLENSGIPIFETEGSLVLHLVKLRSFVSLGISTSLISSMNGSILTNEISSLIQDIESDKIARLGEFGGVRSHLRHKEISLTKEMFEVPVVENKESHAMSSSVQEMTFKREEVSKVNVFNKGQEISKSITKGHDMNTGATFRPIQNAKPQVHDSGNSKSDIAIRLGRRNTILKLIKDRKEVTIKEVSSIVQDVSEKTIQRELLNLVSEGVLKKTGEKRWSKYSLKV